METNITDFQSRLEELRKFEDDLIKKFGEKLSEIHAELLKELQHLVPEVSEIAINPWHSISLGVKCNNDEIIDLINFIWIQRQHTLDSITGICLNQQKLFPVWIDGKPGPHDDIDPNAQEKNRLIRALYNAFEVEQFRARFVQLIHDRWTELSVIDNELNYVRKELNAILQTIDNLRIYEEQLQLVDYLKRRIEEDSTIKDKYVFLRGCLPSQSVSACLTVKGEPMLLVTDTNTKHLKIYDSVSDTASSSVLAQPTKIKKIKFVS